MVSRHLLTILATLALALAAGSPQAQSPQLPQQTRVPAPDRHPATGLTFPPQIANAQKAYSLDYGKGMQRPELGYAWNYQIGRLLSATVYVYNLSVQAIPDGPSSPPVIAQFQRSLEDIRAAAQAKRYDQLKVVKGPADCAFGSVVFRCITLSAIQNNAPIHTSLMVTGYRNHFVKVRLDWLEGSELGQASVDRFVQTLVGTTLR